MNSPQNILSILNDDCFIGIIKQDCIGINDLIEIASTCKRLQSIAREVFRIKFKKIDHSDEVEKWPIQQTAVYLRHFGELIDTFDTAPLHNRNTVLKLVMKYCKNITNLRCIASEYFDSTSLRGLCAHLKTLEYGGEGFKGAEIFEENAPLEQLSLFTCGVQLPVIQLPHLKQVDLVRTNRNNTRIFFRLNPQILRLNVRHVSLNSDIALEYLVNLEELSFLDIEPGRTLQGFRNLNRLKKLCLGHRIDCVLEALITLHRIKAPLESLTVYHSAIINEAITNRICQFETMKYLRLKRSGTFPGPSSEHLIRILKSLPLLKTLICDQMRLNPSKAHKILLECSDELQSARFRLHICDNAEDFMIVADMSSLARDKNINIIVDMFLYSRSVSYQD